MAMKEGLIQYTIEFILFSLLPCSHALHYNFLSRGIKLCSSWLVYNGMMFHTRCYDSSSISSVALSMGQTLWNAHIDTQI